MSRSVGALAVMAGLLVQCSGGDQLNDSETAPVVVLEKPGGEARAPKPGTQLCDEPGRPAAELEGARLFLSGSLPHVYRLGDDARARLRSEYARDDVEAALKMHRDYDSVAQPALRQWLDRDAAGLRASFRLALPIAERIYGARLEPAPPERRGTPSGYEIEYQSRYLPLQLAYFILALDEDYSAFEKRIELISAARWSPDLQSSDFRRTEAAHRPPHFAVRNREAVRALAMHRLLQGQEGEAEKAMLFLLETRLVEDRRHRFTPYEARELLVAARATDATFRKFAAKPSREASAELGCSDFYFLYVEWLDMRSRAAIAKGRRQSATAAARESAALAKAVPATLLGPPALAALTDIERRIARFLAGETR